MLEGVFVLGLLLDLDDVTVVVDAAGLGEPSTFFKLPSEDASHPKACGQKGGIGVPLVEAGGHATADVGSRCILPSSEAYRATPASALATGKTGTRGEHVAGGDEDRWTMLLEVLEIGKGTVKLPGRSLALGGRVCWARPVRNGAGGVHEVLGIGGV